MSKIMVMCIKDYIDAFGRRILETGGIYEFKQSAEGQVNVIDSRGIAWWAPVDHFSGLGGLPPAPDVICNQAMRRNEGKPKLHALACFPHALAGVSNNQAFGASKYDTYNFMKGAPATESFDCALRHMLAWFGGEDQVQEAQAKGYDVNHLDAAIWNLLRLREELVMRPKGFVDDRPTSLVEHGYKVKP